MRHILLASLVVLAVAAVTADVTLYQTIKSRSELSTLAGAIDLFPSIKSALDAPGTYTVFAPTNDALSAYTGSVTADLLLFHVLGVSVPSTALAASNIVPTLLTNSSLVQLGGSGQVIKVVKDTGVYVQTWNGASPVRSNVVTADISATNGYIHTIDAVLSIPTKSASQVLSSLGLTTLVSALDLAQLTAAVNSLPSLTLFAPTNAAFPSLPGGSAAGILQYGLVPDVLTYHVATSTGLPFYSTKLQAQMPTLEGDALSLASVQAASLETIDIVVPNGVIHTIKAQVLLPPPLPRRSVFQNLLLQPATSKLATGLLGAEYNTVAQLLHGNPAMNLTLFAPVNAAAAAIDFTQVAEVSRVLQYHVVPAKVLSTSLPAETTAPTLLTDTSVVNLNGSPQRLVVVKDPTVGVYIRNGVPGTNTYSRTFITTVDIVGTNGVIHLIDGVLSYPKASASSLAVAANLTSLVTAVIRANLTQAIDSLAGVCVFAPTQDAFALLTTSTADFPLQLLTRVLQGHVSLSIGQCYTNSWPASFPSLLDGSDLKVVPNADGSWSVNGAQVALSNVLLPNGVLHVIDKVLLPPATAADTLPDTLLITRQTQALSGLLRSPAYAAALNVLSSSPALTLFAPSDAAIAASGINPADVSGVTSVLLYHLVGATVASGDLAAVNVVPTQLSEPKLGANQTQRLVVLKQDAGVLIPNGNATAQVILANLPAKNGIIHVVNRLLLPPSALATALGQWSDLSSLLSALADPSVSDLLANVTAATGITLFAPTNDAIAKAQSSGYLSASSLRSVLLDHVVAGPSPLYYSSKTALPITFTALSGKQFTLALNGGAVTVGDTATVVLPNILAQNGVVHKINGVLGYVDDSSSSGGLRAGLIVIIVLSAVITAGLTAWFARYYCCKPKQEQSSLDSSYLPVRG